MLVTNFAASTLKCIRINISPPPPPPPFKGDHSVEVKLSDSHVEGSPFLVKAYNADKVKVTDINNGVVGKPVFFSSEYHYSFPWLQFLLIIYTSLKKNH